MTETKKQGEKPLLTKYPAHESNPTVEVRKEISPNDLAPYKQRKNDQRNLNLPTPANSRTAPLKMRKESNPSFAHPRPTTPTCHDKEKSEEKRKTPRYDISQ